MLIEGVINSYFRYKCEKVILSSWGRLRASEACYDLIETAKLIEKSIK